MRASPLDGRLARAALIALAASLPASVRAAEWSVTELQYQRGRLAAPKFAGSGASATNIVTLQHASGWKLGEAFVFVDFLDDGEVDGFNDRDAYGEAYVALSFARMTGRRVGTRALKDVGLVLGVNADADAEVRKWLPGVRLSWNAKGFAFLNTDVTAYLDDSAGRSRGGAPSEGSSWMLDVSFARPFATGRHAWSVEGHAEWIGPRTNELGRPASSWVLAQPQLRFDLGKALRRAPDRVFVGVEWQYWRHVLGDRATTQHVPQALLVWRF